MRVFDTLTLDRSGAEPLGRQLARAIEERVLDDSLPPGSRLPPVRALAARLGLNYNTVAGVYRSLAGRGLLELRRGGGTRVSAVPPKPDPARSRADRLADAVLAQVREAGLDAVEFARAAARRAELGRAARPLRVLAVGLGEAGARELLDAFIAVPWRGPGPELRAVALAAFDPSVLADVLVTEPRVLERARSARSSPAAPVRRSSAAAHRQAFLRAVEGAD